MGLYLSSYRVPNPEKLHELLGKDMEAAKGLVITNAKEKRSIDEQNSKFEDLKADLSKIGLRDIVRVDLRRGIPDLSDIDYIYAAGGNTFDLRRAMFETEFDDIVKEYVLHGGVYVGESAGAIVAGPSLQGFESMDPLPDDPIWEGLKLTDTVIVPHNDSADPAFNNRAPRIREQNPGLSVIALNDDQDFVVS